MDKKEYFDLRLKRDFIDHVLLQKPLLSSNEVSGRLIRSTTDLYFKLKSMIKPVCENALSKEKLKQNGKYVNKLPEWLNQHIVDEINDNFKVEIRTSGILEYYREELFYAIEKLTWQQGVDDMSLNLQDFISYLSREARQYEAMPQPEEENYSVQKKEANAKRITPREFLAGDNYKDILAFRETLIQYSEAMCEYEVYRMLGNFYREILLSGRIERIVVKYKNIQAEAEKEREVMKNLDPNEEWDKEYERQLPVAFFERNIEGIDATRAFQMIIFQLFAQNEEMFRKEGYLSKEGRLRFFTNPDYDGMRWKSLTFSTFIPSSKT